MRKTVVTEFIVGQTVAESIYNKQGMLLLRAGMKLTTTIVERLRKDGIGTVWIQ